MATDVLETSQKSGLDHLSLCEYQLRMTLEFVQMADRKARFLMRIGLGLFAATFVGLPPSVQALKEQYDAGALTSGGTGVTAFVAVVLLYTVCVTCLVIAMMKVIAVVRPRILSDEQAAPSPFFFQSIARMDLPRYKQMMRELDGQQAVDELTTMIYHNSLVADAKFRKLDQAVRWMLGGGLFGFVFALLVIVSVQLL